MAKDKNDYLAEDLVEEPAEVEEPAVSVEPVAEEPAPLKVGPVFTRGGNGRLVTE